MTSQSPRYKAYDPLHYVESAGVVPFLPGFREVALLRDDDRHEWRLPKGRRHHGESRANAAIRCTNDETGLTCTLLPITIRTRATPPNFPTVETSSAVLPADTADKAYSFSGSTEPFVLTTMDLGYGTTKLIWWYIGEVDADAEGTRDAGMTDNYHTEYYNIFDFEGAVEKLTHDSDREVLRQAVKAIQTVFSLDYLGNEIPRAAGD